MRLRKNKDYQFLCNELKQIKDLLDKFIFDENGEHEAKKIYITKRRCIDLFLELPEDLIKQYTPLE